MSCSSGYGYGIWLKLKHDRICTDHISHITLVCNVSTEKEIRNLYNSLKTKLPDALRVKIHPSSTIFEDVYSENDPYPRAWGFYCDTINYDAELMISQIEKLMHSLSITGSVSKKLHTTIGYTEWNNKYNLRETIETDCKIVMADIRKYDSVQWSIVTDK